MCVVCVFSIPKELNNHEQHSVLRQKKKLTSTFLFLDNLASLRPAIIESPTIRDVLGFHSSASVLLSVLLAGLYISGCVLGNIGSVSVLLFSRKYNSSCLFFHAWLFISLKSIEFLTGNVSILSGLFSVMSTY